MDKNDLFDKQILNLRRKISSFDNYKDIEDEIDGIFNYIQNNWKELEFFTKFDILIEELLSERVTKDKIYCSTFLIKYLNIYIDLIKTDFYNSWGVIFSKILKFKLNFNFPEIYSYVLKFNAGLFANIFKNVDLAFPLERDLPLTDIIREWKAVFEEIIANSSSYVLLFDAQTRNRIALYLYEYLKSNNSLSIWFPFAGIGIEPLLFSYIINLLVEADGEKGLEYKFKIYCSDRQFDGLKKGIEQSPFEEIFFRIKKDFANQNGIEVKNIKTNMKIAKRSIILEKSDLIYKGETLDKTVDFALINSLKMSRYDEYRNKICKIFKSVDSISPKTKFIYEVKSKFSLSWDELDINGYDGELLTSNLNCFNDDNYILFFLAEKIKNAPQTNEKNADASFYEIYEKKEKLSPKEIKKLLNDNKFNLSKKNIIKMADLYASINLFSKAFALVKENYEADYSLSYKILSDIRDKSKNNKLKLSAERFIIDKKIKEMGFSSELVEAIAEEIDDYFDDNPNSILKRKIWL
jgi:hypothetical protein